MQTVGRFDGNPVDYDYTGQTLHFSMDEKLSNAGYFKEKWKQGASYLVDFAQQVLQDGRLKQLDFVS